MTQIAQLDFTSNLVKLLKETFEGPPADEGSAFLDKGAGLFQTIGSISAEVASRPPSPGAPTIAAHCYHLGYYVRVLRNFILGLEQEVDWASSWQVQELRPQEWRELQIGLERDYEALRDLLATIPVWADEEVGDSMAILAHTAYHLGAIRQALRAAQFETGARSPSHGPKPS